MFKRLLAKKVEEYIKISGGISLEGPKNVGKTTLCEQFAKSAIYLSDPKTRESVEANYKMALDGETPRLIDEWQLIPNLWNSVKNEIDRRKQRSLYIMTGSIIPEDTSNLDSAAGRIMPLTLGTLTFTESNISNRHVSFNKLMSDPSYNFASECNLTFDDYIKWIVKGGWPETFNDSIYTTQTKLKVYLNTIIKINKKTDTSNWINEKKLLSLIHAYARNIGNQPSDQLLLRESKIDAAVTLDSYKQILFRRFIVDTLQPWKSHLRSSIYSSEKDKYYLVDPSLACAILRATPEKLLRDLNFTGFLFENMVIKDLKIYAELIEAKVSFIRDSKGFEIDAIIENLDGTFSVFEIKLGSEARIEDGINNLTKLKNKMEEEHYKKLISLNLITTGKYSYTRKDGINIIAFGDLYFDEEQTNTKDSEFE